MADGTFTPTPLSGPERATVARNLMFEALNAFPEALADDGALAVSLACIVDTVEMQRPESRVRTLLATILEHPRGRDGGR